MNLLFFYSTPDVLQKSALTIAIGVAITVLTLAITKAWQAREDRRRQSLQEAARKAEIERDRERREAEVVRERLLRGRILDFIDQRNRVTSEVVKEVGEDRGAEVLRCLQQLEVEGLIKAFPLDAPEPVWVRLRDAPK